MPVDFVFPQADAAHRFFVRAFVLGDRADRGLYYAQAAAARFVDQSLRQGLAGPASASPMKPQPSITIASSYGAQRGGDIAARNGPAAPAANAAAPASAPRIKNDLRSSIDLLPGRGIRRDAGPAL
ncbi:hypothetical protein [Lysobacter capsici]|uniref:hypothetical protein n=1 Tax=Lysobacter capsici TaxID=435897 RepID=UPI00398D2B0C